MQITNIDGRFLAAGKRASKEGEQAQAEGKPLDANPYKYDPFLSLQWRRAWCRANYWKPQQS